MSIRAYKWGWGKKLKPASKLILLALAESADVHGVCWPRIKRVATMCCVSVRTVQRTIKELEEGGFLSVSYRYCVTGRQMSSVYTLGLDIQAAELLSVAQVSRDMANCDILAGTGVADEERGEGDASLSCQQPLQEQSFEPKRRFELPSCLSGEDRLSIERMLDKLLDSEARRVVSLLKRALRGRKIRGAPAAWVLGVIKNGGYRAKSEDVESDYVRKMMKNGFSRELAEQIAGRTVS